MNTPDNDTHLSGLALEALAAGDAAESAAQLHLESCAACRERLDAMREENRLFSAELFVATTQENAMTAAAATASNISRLPAPVQSHKPLVLYAAAASIMIVAALGMILWGANPNGPKPPRPEKALGLPAVGHDQSPEIVKGGDKNDPPKPKPPEPAPAPNEPGDPAEDLKLFQEAYKALQGSLAEGIVLVSPDILAKSELGDHFETINPDRPDTHSAFGNRDAHIFNHVAGNDGIEADGGSFGVRTGGGRRLMVTRQSAELSGELVSYMRRLRRQTKEPLSDAQSRELAAKVLAWFKNGEHEVGEVLYEGRSAVEWLATLNDGGFDQAQTREKALHALKEIGRDGLPQILAQLRKAPPSDAIYTVLGQIEVTREDLPKFTELLKDESFVVRKAAVQLLGNLAETQPALSKEIETALTQALNDRDKAVVEWARAALRRLANISLVIKADDAFKAGDVDTAAKLLNEANAKGISTAGMKDLQARMMDWKRANDEALVRAKQEARLTALKGELDRFRELQAKGAIAANAPEIVKLTDQIKEVEAGMAGRLVPPAPTVTAPKKSKTEIFGESNVDE